jgi:hypothetical protein
LILLLATFGLLRQLFYYVANNPAKPIDPFALSHVQPIPGQMMTAYGIKNLVDRDWNYCHQIHRYWQ